MANNNIFIEIELFILQIGGSLYRKKAFQRFERLFLDDEYVIFLKRS